MNSEYRIQNTEYRSKESERTPNAERRTVSGETITSRTSTTTRTRKRLMRRQKTEDRTPVNPEPQTPNSSPEDDLAAGAEGKDPTKCGQWTSKVGGDGEREAGVNP